MINRSIYIALVFAVSLIGNMQGQYTLRQLVDQARVSSPKALKASLNLKKSDYQYTSFRAGYRPNVNMSGTLPRYNRTIQNVPQPDGSIDFLPISQINTIGDLNVTQNIGLTGGQIFMNSGVQRYKDFNLNVIRYSAVPVSVGLSQPIFKANPYRWNKNIEPLKLEKAKKEYVETMEEIAMDISRLYFDLLLSQVSIEIASRNVSLNDTLYKIAKGRYNLGKIAENELLQMKLSFMNSKRDLKQARISQQSNRLSLLRYLDLKDSTSFSLNMSSRIPEFAVDKEMAYLKSMSNKARIVEFELRKLENDKNLAVSVSSNRFNADLRASYGFANSASTFNSLYSDPTNQSGFSVGVSVPLYNGGRNRSEVKIARTDYDIQQINLEQDKQQFEMETKLFIEQFPLFKEQLVLAFESDTIAMKRYDIAVKRYMIGKTDITDLNIALNERNQAKRSLLSSLKSYWEGYYKLRFFTLYDFEKNEDISY